MRFSVITPTHDERFLSAAYESLLAQTTDDWEWILVANNGADIPKLADPRIRVIDYEQDHVGALKWHGAQQASGEWIVELDHDDRLMPTCLERIGESKADFVYSNCIQIRPDYSPVFWGDEYGWVWRPLELDGHEVFEAVSPDPYPSNFSRIWFAPNHVRAWRREFYMGIGGHNETMLISDDHDLCCRSFLHGTVEHIDEPLYVYVVHGENTWMKHGQRIQDTMWENHDRYFVPMMERWAKDNGLALVDLGGYHNPPADYAQLDRRFGHELEGRWPLEDCSVGLLRAHEILEHLSDPVHAMNEAYRVLAHGGALDLLVPSTAGMGAFCDPTHKSYWNLRSLRYYTEKDVRAYIEPECTCRFQVVKAEEVSRYENIPFVSAQLLAVKDGPRLHGGLKI